MNLEELREEIDAIDENPGPGLRPADGRGGPGGPDKRRRASPYWTLPGAGQAGRHRQQTPPRSWSSTATPCGPCSSRSAGAIRTPSIPSPPICAKEIERAIESTPQPLPPLSATVACQGVEGPTPSWPARSSFKHPQVMYFGSFESVFTAIENGFCDYGVLPWKTAPPGP